jgi:hypothetical protein
MGRTERWGLVVGSFALLLTLSAPYGGAAPVAPDGPAAASSSTLSGPPAEFAERITRLHERHVGERTGESLLNAIELIVLAAVCAAGVAYYSSAAAEQDATRLPRRIRQR